MGREHEQGRAAMKSGFSQWDGVWSGNGRPAGAAQYDLDRDLDQVASTWTHWTPFSPVEGHSLFSGEFQSLLCLC